MLVTLQQEVPFLLSKLSYGSRDDSYIINFLNRRKRFLPVNFIVKKQIPQFFFVFLPMYFGDFCKFLGVFIRKKGAIFLLIKQTSQKERSSISDSYW